MRRLALFAAVGLGLASIAGCHHWRNKHLARASYMYADPCGCGDVYPGHIEGVPVATAQSYPIVPGKLAPAPSSTVVSTPQR
jgi:hypothetical protein